MGGDEELVLNPFGFSSRRRTSPQIQQFRMHAFFHHMADAGAGGDGTSWETVWSLDRASSVTQGGHMAGQRRGLGRGLGALIPQEDGGNRPRDVPCTCCCTVTRRRDRARQLSFMAASFRVSKAQPQPETGTGPQHASSIS